jgi:polygalacturonase
MCTPACLTADCSRAFQKAIGAASSSSHAANGGVTVLVPAGTYVLKKDISITRSNVVLRGAGVRKQPPHACLPGTLFNDVDNNRPWPQ